MIGERVDTRQLSMMDSYLMPIPSKDDATEWTLWQRLKGEVGSPSIESVKEAALRLDLVTAIGLPGDLFRGCSPQAVDRYWKQARVQEPHELRRHTPPLRSTLLAAYVHRRRAELTDHFVDLFAEIVHKFIKNAQTKVESGFKEALNKANMKVHTMYRTGKAILARPKGIVEDVIFPEASREWWLALIREVEGDAVRRAGIIHAIQRSYSLHYRRMLPDILRHLEFRTTSTDASLITAIQLLRDHMGSPSTHYPAQTQVPTRGIVPKDWTYLVMETVGGRQRVNRIAYEACVLMALRDKLRCREVWVDNGYRYRNPEEDLPRDFQSKRSEYYKVLGISDGASAYVTSLRQEMRDALVDIDRNIPANTHVSIVKHGDGHRFSISPYKPLDEPMNIGVLKEEVFRRWSGTSLLDVLKETDLRLHFTNHFRSGTDRSHLERNTLRRRLLLCLFAMGTNTGIKSMESGLQEEYKELLYVRRRFITADTLRDAIADVANATLKIRNTAIWGEATSACASDSKQFKAWDQNLLTEWHMRYGGRGVMVYWHVENRSTCIYSQIKRVSSSEAAAMINGVLRHSTEMDIKRQYVDTHGQNTVAFAIARLLQFELLPRIKGVNRQKLHRPSVDLVLPNLDKKVMTPSTIDWGLIESNFDSLVKYVVSLKLGLADADSLMRQFTRDHVQSPVYKAFLEFGKVIKTIFLCRYLSSETLRREVHHGLNVVESWNSTNGFIHYGREGELSSNRREDQEMGLLSLHLLQACLVYINTIMIQRVLQDPVWLAKLDPRDLAALSPLLTQHINRYGRFELDLRKRIPLNA